MYYHNGLIVDIRPQHIPRTRANRKGLIAHVVEDNVLNPAALNQLLENPVPVDKLVGESCESIDVPIHIKPKPKPKPGNLIANRGTKHFTDDAIRQIHKMHLQGISGKDIAPKFNVSPSAIYQILSGRTYNHIWNEFNQHPAGSKRILHPEIGEPI